MSEFVPATRALAEAFYGAAPPFSFRGWVCLIDGTPAGVCGLYEQGGHRVAFSDIAPAYRDRRKDIVRGIRLVRGAIEASPIPVYAKANPEEPGAEALLTRLGFEPLGEFMVRR